MKAALLHAPVVLSLLVAGAHFLRFGNTVGVITALLLMGLLILRQAWVARLVQVALVLFALEWAWTLYGLVQMRAAHDLPFTRMAIILGAVAAVTFCSALVFQAPVMKRIYGLNRPG